MHPAAIGDSQRLLTSLQQHLFRLPFRVDAGDPQLMQTPFEKPFLFRRQISHCLFFQHSQHPDEVPGDWQFDRLLSRNGIRDHPQRDRSLSGKHRHQYRKTGRRDVCFGNSGGSVRHVRDLIKSTRNNHTRELARSERLRILPRTYVLFLWTDAPAD